MPTLRQQVTGAPSPWTNNGSVVRLLTLTDKVAVGSATMFGAEKFRVSGTGRFEGNLTVVSDNQDHLTLERDAATARTYQLRVDSTGRFVLRDVTGAADRVFVLTTGEVGIGAAPAAGDKLSVAGPIRTTDANARFRAAVMFRFGTAADAVQAIGCGALLVGATFDSTPPTGEIRGPFTGSNFAINARNGVHLKFQADGATRNIMQGQGEGRFAFGYNTVQTDSHVSIKPQQIADTYMLKIADFTAVNVWGFRQSPQQFGGPLGSAASPAVAFESDLNTGLFSPGADTLALSTAGSERVRVTSAGAFLVAATTAVGTEKLRVAGEARLEDILRHTGASAGFFGASPAAQQAVATLTNNVTAGGTDDQVADFTDLVLYVNDAATIRNDIYQLARKVKQVVDALRLYGLLG